MSLPDHPRSATAPSLNRPQILPRYNASPLSNPTVSAIPISLQSPLVFGGTTPSSSAPSSFQAFIAAPSAAAGGPGSSMKGPRGSNLFVKGLPEHITDEDLLTLFVPFGRVLSAHVFKERTTRKSRGYGFVSFSQHHQAQSAIAAMDGFSIGGAKISVALTKGDTQVTAVPGIISSVPSHAALASTSWSFAARTSVLPRNLSFAHPQRLTNGRQAQPHSQHHYAPY